MQVQRKLTVVDDVPHAGDPVQRRRLTELLVQLARSSRFPRRPHCDRQPCPLRGCQ